MTPDELSAFIINALRLYTKPSHIHDAYVDASGGFDRAVIDGIYDVRKVAEAIINRMAEEQKKAQ